MATTVYVKTDGSETSPYDTWAKAAKLCSTAQTYLDGRTSTGHIMYVAPGTYTDDFLNLTDADAQDETIFGVSTAGIAANATGDTCLNYPAAKADIMLAILAGKDSISFSKTGIKIKNITLKDADSTHSGIIGTAGDVTLTNCQINDCASYIIYLSGTGTTVTTNKSRFYGGANIGGWEAAVYLQNTSNFTSNYDIFTGSPSKPLGKNNVFYNHGTGTLTLNNTEAFATSLCPQVILQDAAGALVVNNAILSGGTVANVRTTAGSGAVSNSILNYQPGGAALSGTITDTNNQKGVNPLLVNARFPAIIIPCIDDSDASASGYIAALAAELVTRNLRGTWFIEADGIAGVAETIAAVSGNMSIGVHSRTHSSLDVANGRKLYDVTKAAETITIDRTAGGGTGTITLSGGGSVTSFKTKTLEGIKTSLEALGATVTANATYVGAATGKIRTGAWGEVIADGTAINALNLLVSDDTEGLFKSEIVDAKTVAEVTLGAGDAKTFSNPYGVSVAAAETAMQTAGYISARPNSYAATHAYLLSSVNIFDLTYINSVTHINPSGTATDAEIKQNAVNLCEFLVNSGGIVYLLAHSTSELTIAQWKIVLAVIASYAGITVTDANTATTTITSSPWAGGPTTYTRTMPFATDFHLQGGSPAINAGTDVSLTEDYEGVSVPYSTVPCIGAYEGVPIPIRR
jgi:hypothetical protein